MKKISIFLLAFASLITVSCDKDFEKINTDPNNPVEVPAHLLLGNIIRNTQNELYNTFNGGDMGLCWAQQWSKTVYNDEERYIPRRSTVVDIIWRNIYSTVLLESKSMETLAMAEGNTNLQGISLILRANAFHILTDLYGPIPFSEALDSNNTQPAFDSEPAVYAGILAMLDQADALLASGTGDVPASSDLVYGGNVSKWRKLGNALKFKALMRIAKVQNVNADLQALVNAGNLMSSNGDSAQLTYLASQPDANPIYETIVYGARPEFKVSSVLISKLQTLNDPRLAAYAQKNTAGAYVGNVPGTLIPGNYSAPGTRILDPTFPGVIMSYAQQELLLAEAINEGYVSGTITDAKTHYVNGITASMTTYGLSATAYLVQPSVDFTAQAEARTKIGEQEWLALYGQGLEAWTEWRRTGLPALSPVVGAAIPSIPTRLYYPTTENSLNSANYQAASATLDNGDNLTSHLWWN